MRPGRRSLTIAKPTILLAGAQCRVMGGHLCHGSLVRTTAELLLAVLPAQQGLRRSHDAATGYDELVIGRSTSSGHPVPNKSHLPQSPHIDLNS